MFNIINNKNGFHNINNGTANEHDSYLKHSYCVNGVERTREHSLMNGVAMPWRRNDSGCWCGVLSKSRKENMYAYVSTYVIHYISYYLGIFIYVVFVVIVNIVGSAILLLFCFSPYTYSYAGYFFSSYAIIVFSIIIIIHIHKANVSFISNISSSSINSFIYCEKPSVHMREEWMEKFLGKWWKKWVLFRQQNNSVN